MPASIAGVMRSVLCTLQKLYHAKCRPTAAFRCDSFLLYALVRRVNRRFAIRIVELPKLVPSFFVGKRVGPDTWQLLWDLQQRFANPVQLTTDGLNHYGLFSACAEREKPYNESGPGARLTPRSGLPRSLLTQETGRFLLFSYLVEVVSWPSPFMRAVDFVFVCPDQPRPVCQCSGKVIS